MTKLKKYNLSDQELEKAIKECELIDDLLPRALPLYINYPWVNDDVAKRYRDKLENARELMEIIEKVTANPDKK